MNRINSHVNLNALSFEKFWSIYLKINVTARKKVFTVSNKYFFVNGFFTLRKTLTKLNLCK